MKINSLKTLREILDTMNDILDSADASLGEHEKRMAVMMKE